MKIDASTMLTPLIKKLDRERAVAFSRKGLEILGLRVGDKVKASFYGSVIRGKNSYGVDLIQEGVIKEENNVAFVESISPIPKTRNVSNGRSGRSYRSQWESYEEITRTGLTQIKEIL